MGYKRIRNNVEADTVKSALHAFQIAQEAQRENRRRAANGRKNGENIGNGADSPSAD